MAFDPTNEQQVQEAYTYALDRIKAYYSSSFYSHAWARHDKRLRAYYCREQTKGTHWRSKLHFATFWLACQAYHARFVDAHRTDPFVFVKPSDDSQRDPDAREKAQLAHVDLNYDLKRSGFKERLLRMMYPHVERFGTAVAREYIRTRQDMTQARRVVPGPYGGTQGSEVQTQYKRIEYTCTQPIHPLNFAHDMGKSDFNFSQWGSVRFELPLSELYMMVDNPAFYQPGVQKCVEAVKASGAAWASGEQQFYSENGDSDGDRRHLVIVDEYYGPLWIDGNEMDITIYHVLLDKTNECVLQIEPSMFGRIPYWKIQAYSDPEGPYGVGPCDMLLPINLWENKTVNQYVDYMNAALKYMWKVNPSNISGGMRMLVDGLPAGMVPIEDDENGRAWNQALEPLKNNMGTLPPVADVMGLIERYKQNQGPSNNTRGKDSSQLNDTATGISLMAQKEDMMAAGVQATIDEGLKNGLWIKMDNMSRYFQEPRVAEVQRDGQQVRVEHYPYELGGVEGFSFEIKRQTSDIEAGKNMSWLKLLMGIQKMVPMPPETVIDAVENVGVAMGVDGVDEMFQKVRESVREKIPGDVGMGGGGASGGPPGMPPGLTPAGGAPAPQPAPGGADALAAALA